MISRRCLSFALLGVILWNAVLGGVGAFIICSHDNGDAHLSVQNEDCLETCNDTREAGNCEDLELASIDLLALRQDTLKLVFAPLTLPPVAEPIMPRLTELRLMVAPLRGPPAQAPHIHVSVPTTVLII